MDTVATRSSSIDWKGRAATRLSNGIIELTVLTGGGHLAEFRFLSQTGIQSPNVFWEAPWISVDPTDNRLPELARVYGSVEIGRFLAGFTGHALCLDRFGEPSTEQAAAGLTLHGEAGVRNWNVMQPANTSEAVCQWNVRLPVAQLRLDRQILLGNRESVVYVKESVYNERNNDHLCHWVQHATFGPPFLNPAECTVGASAWRGMTSPFGYEDCSLLKKSREFVWPYAPHEESEEAAVDLRYPFSTKRRGFLAGVQMDPSRQVQYILAVNWKLRLGVGYCFRQQDFPWMAIWEENCTHSSSPWNASTQARGMEFGTTPMPPGPSETFPGCELFDTPVWCTIPASGTRKMQYVIFLVKIPIGMHTIENVEAKGDAIEFYGDHGDASLSIPAHGCEAFLSADDAPDGTIELQQ